MPVYQPNAVVGNSRVLVSLGARAELMSFFYPHIDFPQNLHEGMPAVFFPSPGALAWTFEPSWQAEQSYVGQTNIVESRLRHANTGLSLTVTDFVHPSEPALFRRFEATNTSDQALEARLFQYLDLQLGEVQNKNAVHYHAERGLAVAYWRNICFAISGEGLDHYGCGRAGTSGSAKQQMASGQLNHQSEEIGDIDLALGWSLTLGPGDRATKDLLIVAEANEPAAVERAEGYRSLGWEALARWVRSAASEHLAPSRQVHIEPDLQQAYQRCLLAVDLLVDPDTGSVLAAPEFDPAFERCGGYGYCWPRDGVEVCLALEAAGYPSCLERFLAWARRAQRTEGYWEQRYWLSGQRGPAWCTHQDTIQIDQTASVLFAMGRCARHLGEMERARYLEVAWDSARRAAAYLADQMDPATKLHAPGFDLWETHRGTFAYSNAAIAAALTEGAFLAELAGASHLASEWRELASQTKRAVMDRLWLGDVFARGLDLSGRLDRGADASMLGLVVPFEFLSLSDPEERSVARACVEGLVRRLGERVGGAETLRRFDGDQYAGGGPSALTTIWLARVMLKLALSCQDDPGAAASYGRRAVASMRAVLAAGTPTGLMPEMMGAAPGQHWAVPHAWTSAAFIAACLLLDQLATPRRRGTSG